LRLIGLDPVECAPLLAPLVDIPLPPNRMANFAPEELRRRQLAAMTAWVLAGARSQPVILAFEDLQWADPTSLDLLRALADRGGQAPLLVIATSRPEFRLSWGMRSLIAPFRSLHLSAPRFIKWSANSHRVTRSPKMSLKA
jgi:predicted ATPase